VKQKLLLFYDIEDRYSGETAGAFPKVKRNLLEAAQNYLGGGALAMLEGRISRKDRLLAELDALGIWFGEEQSFLDCDWLGRLSAVSSGAEHEVFFDPDTQLAIKVTRPGAFGHSVVGPGLSALPSEYLTRWALHNQLFGESVRFLGALKNEAGFQLVISQVWIASRLDCPTASEQEIESYFEYLGFQKMPHLEVPVFFNPALDLVVLDAQPHNVLKDDAGNLVPIDVVIGQPSAWTRDWLGIIPKTAR
jgi:hypothetical protein